MGNVVHRTQQLGPNRSFTPIPVIMSPVTIGRADSVRYVEQPMLQISDDVADAMRYGTAIQQWILDAATRVANPPVVGPTGTLRYMKAKAPKMVMSATPRGGKSLWQKIQGLMHKKSSGMAQADTFPTTYSGAVSRAHAAMMPDGMQGWEPPAEEPPHTHRSAYRHADPQREVPVIRLDVTPAFYMNDDVDAALENSIAAVCSGFNDSLAGKVRGLLIAEYKPPAGVYKPDVDPTPPREESLFERDTVNLSPSEDGTEWVLDIRFSTGVYKVSGHEWLGVFVHGIANAATPAQRSPTDPLGQRRQLVPGSALEEEYQLVHRGQVAPHGLFFDMFVPVEPEIVTTEWGWGDALEQLFIDKTRNAAIDPLGSEPAPAFIDNAWDRKAKHHKTAAQIAQAEALKEHKDYELSLRIEHAQAQRDRARKVLYKYSWKALMLAVIECKQLTVEKKS